MAPCDAGPEDLSHVSHAGRREEVISQMDGSKDGLQKAVAHPS